MRLLERLTRPVHRFSPAVRAGLLVFAVALVVRLALFSPVVTPDSERFMRQASELLAGHGFLWDGRPTADLPPGYSFFLVPFVALGLGATGLALVNAILAAAACVTLYAAVHARDGAPALLAGLCLALHPWAARQSSYVLSESLVLLLACVLLLTLAHLTGGHGAHRPAPSRSRTLTLACAAGLTAGCLPLTAPGTLVFAGALAMAGGWLVWHRPPAGAPRMLTIAALLMGALVPIVPWQIRCHSVTGRFQPFMVAPPVGLTSGVALWTRTWLLREAELHVVFDPTTVAEAPARAFRDESERRRLGSLAEDPARRVQLDQALLVLAAERQRDEPERIVLLAAGRALALWTDMPSISHLQASWVGRLGWRTFEKDRSDVGLGRAVARALKGAFATAGQIVYAGIFVLLAALAVAGVRRRVPLALAIVVGTVAYTAAAAHFAAIESRRNLPFVAALLFLAPPRACTRFARQSIRHQGAAIAAEPRNC